MVLAVFGLWQLWINLVRGHWLGVGSYLVIAFGAATFVSIPRTDPGLWSLDFYNAGIRSLASGDLDLAERNFKTAFAYVSDNSEINFGLGNLWLEKSNRATDDRVKADFRTRAKLYYKRTLDLKPQHASTLNNLGVLAMEEKRWDLSEKFFLGSIDAEPDDAKTYYLLARVRFEAGKVSEAQAPLKKALEMRPNQKEFLELRDKLAAPPKPPAAAGAPQPEPTAK
jgi:tetratricopeptide (TPR) repeat protein